MLRSLPLAFLLVSIGSVDADARQEGSDEARPTARVADDYALVWSDEFDGRELDATKWAPRGLGPRKGGVTVADAITLDGEGHLRITTRRAETESGEVEYHTGMIGTQGRFETTYGYFEVRLRVQSEIGHWSAFWLQSPTMGQPLDDPAKAGVEVDVVEYLCNGHHRNRAQHTLHWNGYGEEHQSAHTLHEVPDMHTGFHVFAVEWTPKEYVFFVDGQETWRFDEAVSQRSQYLILSMEVGTWAGDIAQAELPDGVSVDYVRVFQRQSKKR